MAKIDESRLAAAAEKSPADFLRALRFLRGHKKKISQPTLNAFVLRLVQKHGPAEARVMLPKLISEVARQQSPQRAWNILSFLEVALGFRRPRLGIYDNALHFIGGAQKYGCTIASALKNDFDITLIANKPVEPAELENWYDLDLSGCEIRIIPIPYFEDQGGTSEVVDAGAVDTSRDNPFDVISRESGRYDVFVNNCMLEMVYPLANTSVFICHFPEREKSRFFYVDRYSEITYNSLYTAGWIEKRWNLKPHRHLYPPVDMNPPEFPKEKDNVILSVARFDPGGIKQQLDMVKAFQKLADERPEAMTGWKFRLAGGSPAGNPYLEQVESHLSQNPGLNIDLQVNRPASDVKKIYETAKIFWNFSGFRQTDPAKVEHFGMTVAEAMQNGCVPIIFRGGGQTEIVEDAVSGFLFSSEKELFERTMSLMKDPALLAAMGRRAYERGRMFRREVFVSRVRAHFEELMKSIYPEKIV
jgi:glycosyltransferase involved in cell wall biosynthesis